MSSGLLGTRGYVVDGGTEVTTNRVVTGIKNSLTGIDTKSDAWGKVIPLGFGRVRTAGALVWASQFYRTTQDFDETTTVKNIYTAYGYDYAAGFRNGSSGAVPLAPEDMSRTKSQVTHNTQTDTFIDLCYSFGKEGDTRKRRYVSKIRINNIIAYDNEANYIAPGLGFSIRYGYDNDVPDAMAAYPNGIYHYKGQTLVIFNRFPCANYGDKIPDSVDVEFGCCLVDAPVSQCYFSVPFIKQSVNAPLSVSRDEWYMFAGNFLVLVVTQPIGDEVASSKFTREQDYIVVGNSRVLTYSCHVTQAMVDASIASGDFAITVGNANATLFVMTVSGGINAQQPAAFAAMPFTSLTSQLYSAGTQYQPVVGSEKSYGLIVMSGMDARTQTFGGGFTHDTPETFAADLASPQDAAGFVVTRVVTRSPCYVGIQNG